MMPRRIFLLFLTLMAVSLSRGSQVVQQPETREINADGSVTIECLLHGADSSWMVRSFLKTQRNDSPVCLVSIQGDDGPNYVNGCAYSSNSFNRSLFTLFARKPDTETVYVCEFFKMKPPPVRKFTGKGTKLVAAPRPGCNPEAPVADPMPMPLNWVLMGLAGFLLLCCLIITCAYIKLRVQQDKDGDASMTYVPMQPPQCHVGKRRNGDPDSNTTYMDMRKMQSEGRMLQRDMNYNSCRMNR